ncbi:MAG: thioredoxin family protein [Phycisphaeraceae bacterium]|nr:thioredoxin family protein [Phycisphaeraceae bacterium]
MIETDFLRQKYDQGLGYKAYVATGSPGHQKAWADFRQQVRTTPSQEALFRGFTRQMHVLCVSGTWCGDCVQQVPMLDAIAGMRPDLIHLRLVDRDEHMDLSRRLVINDGLRVPVVLFLNEEFDFVSMYGDRTLTRYRAIADRQLGASCPLPGAPVPPDEIAATLQDWINEAERVQLICRLSTKLRAKHGD